MTFRRFDMTLFFRPTVLLANVVALAVAVLGIAGCQGVNCQCASPWSEASYTPSFALPEKIRVTFAGEEILDESSQPNGSVYARVDVERKTIFFQPGYLVSEFQSRRPVEMRIASADVPERLLIRLLYSFSAPGNDEESDCYCPTFEHRIVPAD
jgi:hypothetical protein